jgi:hypothetical protein
MPQWKAACRPSPCSRPSQIGRRSKRSAVKLPRPIHITDGVFFLQYYKLAGDVALKEAGTDELQAHRVIDNIAISTVAMKSVMNT